MLIGVPSNYPNAMGLGISNSLYYNNANSGLTATTIKGAIDELNTNKQDALPAITNNQSKVLAVNSNATGLEWVEQSSGGGGSGTTYGGGTGIEIDGNDSINVLIDNDTLEWNGSYISVRADKLTDDNTIRDTGNGLEVVAFVDSSRPADFVYLRDQSTSNTYALTIDNGEIVITQQ